MSLDTGAPAGMARASPDFVSILGESHSAVVVVMCYRISDMDWTSACMRAYLAVWAFQHEAGHSLMPGRVARSCRRGSSPRRAVASLTTPMPLWR